MPIDGGRDPLRRQAGAREPRSATCSRTTARRCSPGCARIDNIAYPLKLEGRRRRESTPQASWSRRSTSSSTSSAIRTSCRAASSRRPRSCARWRRARGAVPGRAVLGAGLRDDAVHTREAAGVFIETGTTMMLVSHDLEEAVYLADQVLLLTPAADPDRGGSCRTTASAADRSGRCRIPASSRLKATLPQHIPARSTQAMNRLASMREAALLPDRRRRRP